MNVTRVTEDEQRMQWPKGSDNNMKGEDIRNNINKKTRASEKIDWFWIGMQNFLADFNFE